MNAERQKLYDSHRQELLKRQLSNSENLDRAILMLSSAGLGASLIFVRDLVPLSQATRTLLVYLSWLFFGCAILSTLVSFFVSQKGIKEQLKMIEQYYLECKEEANQKNRWNTATECLSYFCASTYIIAIFFLFLFIVRNLK